VGSINDVIDVLRQAPTNVDRGTLFEKLMVRYFELDRSGCDAGEPSVIARTRLRGSMKFGSHCTLSRYQAASRKRLVPYSSVGRVQKLHGSSGTSVMRTLFDPLTISTLIGGGERQRKTATGPRPRARRVVCLLRPGQRCARNVGSGSCSGRVGSLAIAVPPRFRHSSLR
jgi:hypothetical protein